ncbi:hypothetical protein R1sor_027242 [Riccia sorocarpa]|uniref:Uncharacterized protein n=1 Tax=Riccia sorocarpa TaxID=122646 RepID=A0ABD3GFT2_9MARC
METETSKRSEETVRGVMEGLQTVIKLGKQVEVLITMLSQVSSEVSGLTKSVAELHTENQALKLLIGQSAPVQAVVVEVQNAVSQVLQEVKSSMAKVTADTCELHKQSEEQSLAIGQCHTVLTMSESMAAIEHKPMHDVQTQISALQLTLETQKADTNSQLKVKVEAIKKDPGHSSKGPNLSQIVAELDSKFKSYAETAKTSQISLIQERESELTAKEIRARNLRLVGLSENEGRICRK